MAATIQLQERNGATGTPGTDKTSGTIRFKAADDANVDLSNPIVRPSPGTAYSYEKVLQLYHVTGLVGSITSPRAYSDASSGFGAGITMQAKAVGSYTQPSISQMTGGADFFSYTSGSPLSIGSLTYTPGDGVLFADMLYLQAIVTDAATAGLSASEVLTVAYDET